MVPSSHSNYHFHEPRDRFIPSRRGVSMEEKQAKLRGDLPSAADATRWSSAQLGGRSIVSAEMVQGRNRASALFEALFEKSYGDMSRESLVGTRPTSKGLSLSTSADKSIKFAVESPITLGDRSALGGCGISDDARDSILSFHKHEMAYAYEDRVAIQNLRTKETEEIEFLLPDSDSIQSVFLHPKGKMFMAFSTCSPLYAVYFDHDGDEIVSDHTSYSINYITVPGLQEVSSMLYYGKDDNFALIAQKSKSHLLILDIPNHSETNIKMLELPVSFPGSHVTTMAMCPNDKSRIIVFTSNGEAFLLGVSQKGKVRKMEKLAMPLDHSPTALAWHPNNPSVVAICGGNKNSEIIIWNVVRNQPFYTDLEDSRIDTGSTVSKLIWPKDDFIISSHGLPKTTTQAIKEDLDTSNNVCTWGLNKGTSTSSLGDLPRFVLHDIIFQEIDAPVVHLYDREGGCTVAIGGEDDYISSFKYKYPKPKKVKVLPKSELSLLTIR